VLWHLACELLMWWDHGKVPRKTLEAFAEWMDFHDLADTFYFAVLLISQYMFILYPIRYILNLLL
jgi:hypothetical protein